MNLKPLTFEELNARRVRRKLSPIESVITEFKNMDADAVEIEGYTHKSAESCTASFKATCKRMNCGVDALMIDGKPYLVRKEVL